MVVCVLIGVETVVAMVLHVQAGEIFTALMITGTLDDTLVVETVPGDTVKGSPANRSFFLLWLTDTAGLVGTTVRDAIRRRGAETTERDHARRLQEAQSRRTLGIVSAGVSRGGQRDTQRALSGLSRFDGCASLGDGAVNVGRALLGTDANDAKASVALLIGGTGRPGRQERDVFTDTFL